MSRPFVKADQMTVEGYKLKAVKIEASGACRIHVSLDGFEITSNILLSALPSAGELETLLVRFDANVDLQVCKDIVTILAEMYKGPRHVLRVSDNVTYQGRTSVSSLKRFEEDFR